MNSVPKDVYHNDMQLLLFLLSFLKLSLSLQFKSIHASLKLSQ